MPSTPLTFLCTGVPNTGNNIPKCFAGVDRYKHVLRYNDWEWVREDFGVPTRAIALRALHAFPEYESSWPVWKSLFVVSFNSRIRTQALPH